MKRIAIIGAGIGGMTAAYDLARNGHQVTIFEASDFVGGLASGFKEAQWDWSVEKYYHHWFASDKHMLTLMDELGLRDHVLFQRPYTVMYHDGKFFPFDSIFKAILFPGLGWGLNKIRFGLVGLYLKLTNNWQSLEQYTVDSWMRKWAGDRVYEMMWQPLLIGKFGEHYKDVNMAWMWARLKARTTRLGTYMGGMQTFSDQFADQLRGLGVDIVLSSQVKRIGVHPTNGIELELASGSHHFDQCLVTTSPQAFADLAPVLPTGYLNALKSLKSMGAVVLILSMNKQLSHEGYYWYNIPKSAGFPFLAVVEHTNFVSAEHFAREHIVYCGDYLEPDHEYFSLTKEDLLGIYLPALTRFNPDFNPSWVQASWLFRTKYGQPIPLVNHSKNIPSIATPIPELFFASMSQVYPWDRGTNYAVELARKTARIMQGHQTQ
jgi:protoporphyrinogen oxidase